MGEHALFPGASKRSVLLGSCRHVEPVRDRLHLLEFVRWGMVPESRRELDDEFGCLLGVGWRIHVRRRRLELGMAVQPAGDGIGERHLDIECGQVAGDPALAESLQHRTDVPMLEFDGMAAAVDLAPQLPVVFGLIVEMAREIGSKHREIVRDDEVVLCIRPGAGRHVSQANTGRDDRHRHDEP